MTIDESIEHCKEVAEESRQAALSYARENAYETAISCKAFGHEHEQLAEWLTELKQRREQEKHWIPCSERLPESREDVLVWFEYFRYGEYNCMYQTYNIGNYFPNHGDWMVGHETGWQKMKVLAWMPLPEPPESEVQDDD